MKKSKELESVRNFIVRRMNQERDEHAELLDRLNKRLNGFSVSDDAKEFLSTIHRFRMEFLQELHDFVQDL